MLPPHTALLGPRRLDLAHLTGTEARDQEVPHDLLVSRSGQSNADGQLLALDQSPIGNTCSPQSCKRFWQQGNATPTRHIGKQYVMVSRLLDLPRRKAVMCENTLAVVVERRLTRTLEPEDDLCGEVTAILLRTQSLGIATIIGTRSSSITSRPEASVGSAMKAAANRPARSWRTSLGEVSTTTDTAVSGCLAWIRSASPPNHAGSTALVRPSLKLCGMPSCARLASASRSNLPTLRA